MNKLKASLLPAVCALIGIAMLSTAFYNREEFDTFSFIGSLFFGAFMLGAGVLLFFLLALPEFKEKEPGQKKETMRAVLPNQEDADETGSMISSFRTSYREYFSAPGLPSNSSLQSTVAQLYWHVLYLKKRRMERLGISLDFDARRRSYGGKSIESRFRYDAKYAVTEIRERIDALRIYHCQGRKPFRKKSAELARYTLASARTVSGTTQIVCPNCGAVTTRENLLDGCDYCDTKFRIEDLGPRITSFVLRDDSRIALEKYMDIRSRFELWITLLVTVPVFILSLLGMFSVWGSLDAGPGMKIAAVVFAAAFLTGIAWLAVYYAFRFLFDPIMDRIDSTAAYYTKKAVKERAEREKQSESIALLIRGNDEFFSLEGFFSGVQNKLAAIHFAENASEAAVFASADLHEESLRYRNVADADIVEMNLTGYAREAGFESVSVEVLCDLLTAEGARFRSSSERLALTLIRDLTAKTEAVCSPTVFRCRNCGRSLDLLKGGRCEYCGTSLNLFDRDWIIGEYRILP